METFNWGENEIEFIPQGGKVDKDDYRDAFSAPNPEADPVNVVRDNISVEKKINERDLLKYFAAFSVLFNMHHNTGDLQVVLYDPKTGEVLLPEDSDECEVGL